MNKQNFSSLIKLLEGSLNKPTIAVAAANDESIIQTVIRCSDHGVAEFILVGKGERIKSLLEEYGSSKKYLIIDRPDDADAAQEVAELVKREKADIAMKGSLHTAMFLRSILNKENGLVDTNAMLSQITILEYALEERFVFLTDCAINVNPEYPEKVKIVENAVSFARSIGIELPKVAVIAPVEVINPKMQETLDAAALSKACERGQIKNCIIDGPLSVDNALSLEACKIKGIKSEVAGTADILLMPNLSAGNAIDKAIRYMSDLKTASAVIGAKVPLVMTSRSDSIENKINSVVVAAVSVLKG
jgi:phosphate butyryltransferase